MITVCSSIASFPDVRVLPRGLGMRLVVAQTLIPALKAVDESAISCPYLDLHVERSCSNPTEGHTIIKVKVVPSM